MADLIICRNPFRPQLEREIKLVRAGMRIDTMLRAESMIAGRRSAMRRVRRFVVQVNGKYVLQADWHRRIRKQDLIVVMLLPAGGQGSNPMQMVLMVALVVASAYTGGAVGTAYGSSWGAVAQAGMMIVGSMLINAMLPPPSAADSSLMDREQASPAYALSAQGNSARLLEAIPVLYGRFRLYPDYASQPYTENTGNQNYLYQLFCISQGEIEIEEIRIEDTPIGNYAEVQYEVIRPGQKVTLFPDNVVSAAAVQGLELVGVNERPAGSPDNWTNKQGPFVANPADTEANTIAVDIVLPQGLFYTNDNGGMAVSSISWKIEAQQIDDDGVVLPGTLREWSESLTLATNQPQVLTYRYPVTPGRYQVSAVRTNLKDTNTRVVNVLQWTGLRAYLPSKSSYGNITMLATIIRASNNLNQQIARRINVIATRKLPVWDPVNGWSLAPVATRSPAWAFADALRNTDYGRGLADSRLNLAGLYRLAQVWESRGDRFDGVFDVTSTIWDAISKVARVGRAMPMYYAGVIDVIRNEARTVKTAMFSPDNIAKGSFKVSYKLPTFDTPDHVIVEYTNGVTWKQAEVKCVLPGSTAERPARVQLIGCIDHAHAWREGMSMAASNRDQRQFVTLESELEGHIPRYGDLVQISHDAPAWGLSGFIVERAANGMFRTSQVLEWYAGETHYIAFRRRDGSADGPHVALQGPDNTSFWLQDVLPDLYISNGIAEEYTQYQFGPGQRCGLDALVLSAAPRDDGKIELNFVNYADSPHSAEHGGVIPPPPPVSLLPMQDNAPVLDKVIVYSTGITGQQMVSVTPASGAVSYEYQASNDRGASWMSLGVSADPAIAVYLPAGLWWVRVRGIGVLAGPWSVWQGDITATMLPPPALALLAATTLTTGIGLDWIFPADTILLQAVELRYGLTPVLGDSALLGTFAYPQSSHRLMGLAFGVEFYFWARIIDDAGQPGPWFPGTEAGVLGKSRADVGEFLDAMAGQISKTQLAQDVLRPLELIDNVEDLLAALPDGATVNQIIARQTSIDGDQDAAAAVQLVALANADFSDARQRRMLQAKYRDAQGLIIEESHARASAVGALSEQITTVQATASGAAAQILVTNSVLAETNGKLSALASVKVSVHGPTGQTYTAGYGLGIENAGGVYQSQFLISADKFAFINLNDGALATPFMIENGDTFIKSAFIQDGSITNAKIANASITNAKIADAAITSAKIEDASITSAKIANAAITNAKIGTAEVDTLTIRGNAVTQTTSASGGGNLTLSIVTSGGPVQILGSINGTGRSWSQGYIVEIVLYRNGSELMRSSDNDEWGNLIGAQVMYSDPVPAGTYNYSISVSADGGRSFLSLLETKR